MGDILLHQVQRPFTVRSCRVGSPCVFILVCHYFLLRLYSGNPDAGAVQVHLLRSTIPANTIMHNAISWNEKPDDVGVGDSKDCVDETVSGACEGAASAGGVVYDGAGRVVMTAVTGALAAVSVTVAVDGVITVADELAGTPLEGAAPMDDWAVTVIVVSPGIAAIWTPPAGGDVRAYECTV
jgi:hypothetical protein